jgi:hypothetical protein
MPVARRRVTLIAENRWRVQANCGSAFGRFKSTTARGRRHSGMPVSSQRYHRSMICEAPFKAGTHRRDLRMFGCPLSHADRGAGVP